MKRRTEHWIQVTGFIYLGVFVKAWGASYGGHGVPGPLPSHTAYIFPPADACAPSDDAQSSVGKQKEKSMFKCAKSIISFFKCLSILISTNYSLRQYEHNTKYV